MDNVLFLTFSASGRTRLKNILTERFRQRPFRRLALEPAAHGPGGCLRMTLTLDGSALLGLRFWDCSGGIPASDVGGGAAMVFLAVGFGDLPEASADTAAEAPSELLRTVLMRLRASDNPSPCAVLVTDCPCSPGAALPDARSLHLPEGTECLLLPAGRSGTEGADSLLVRLFRLAPKADALRNGLLDTVWACRQLLAGSADDPRTASALAALLRSRLAREMRGAGEFLAGSEAELCGTLLARLKRLAGRADASASLTAAQMFRIAEACAESPDDADSRHKTVIWYRRAAAKGHPIAQYRLGLFCEEGSGGMTQSLTDAEKWYRRAASRGHTDAQYRLARILFQDGKEGNPFVRTAKRWCLMAARHGHADACCLYGRMGELYGYADRGDEEPAACWYTVAAVQGHPEAQRRLGLAYWFGKGVMEDEDLCLHWLRKAARQGDAEAMYLIGRHYALPFGIPGPTAVKWYRKAADRGYARAMTFVGMAYREGKGVRQSYEKSLKWFRKAVDLEDALAMRCLCTAYEEGLGVEVSDEESDRYRFMAGFCGNDDDPVGHLPNTEIGIPCTDFFSSESEDDDE